MKKIQYSILIVFLVAGMASCSKWLDEKPLDFYAPQNSYTKASDLSAGVTRVYQQVGALINLGNNLSMPLDYPSDVALDNHGIEHDLNSYRDNLIPENTYVARFWTGAYRIIFDCNSVLDRIDNPAIVFVSDAERNTLKAEAMFLRGFSYRLLAILYGGVPLVLNEVTAPKRDYVRAPVADVWKQVISDYKFAAEHLLTQSQLKQDGRLTKGAANHALAEAYIITKEWEKAIAAASEVINSPDYGLMTQRFGTWKTKAGDVYGDLFRRGNVNYIGKVDRNREAIWVDQFEYLKSGGGHANSLANFAGPLYWSLIGNDGVNLFAGPSTQMGGRSTGWLNPTPYVMDMIWTDPNDIRNSSNNIIRDAKADNPKSAFYGQYIVASGSFTKFDNALHRWWHPIFAKTTPINDFPEETIMDKATGITNNGANQTFNDTYYFRLAETYLLRAEAHLGNSDPGKAADDINVVRDRAHAALISAGDVNINYILDERARELHFEEKRVLTLMRLGMQKERVDLYNVMSKGFIQDKHKLWPIPQSEIERNTEAKLDQNLGYR